MTAIQEEISDHNAMRVKDALGGVPDAQAFDPAEREIYKKK